MESVMKRMLVMAVVGAGLMAAAGAHAQNMFNFNGPPTDWSGPEAGIQGGYGWGNSSGHGNYAPPSRYNFDTDGGLGGIHGGYNWQRGNFVLGLEGDIEGGEIGGKGCNPSCTFGLAGSRSVGSSLDADASVRGKLGYSLGRFLVYGTGGAAFGRVTTHYNAPVGTRIAGNTDIRTGWTAGGGIAYAITPNLESDIEYRYTDLGSHTQALGGGVFDRNDFNYNMIRVGLTYRFAPPPPPPPPPAAPMPAAAPAPAPAPQARTFLVFFDFDRSNLTADARHVIDAAIASYRSTGSARVEVSGYTDLAGTQAYNLRLSQRRADAVANYMMHQGLPKNVMDVKWFGKQHPRVPTPDGVREPQNRRVEIVMD
jgi:outer membrane protein OmpA-like peptidoglycan-associated protein